MANELPAGYHSTRYQWMISTPGGVQPSTIPSAQYIRPATALQNLNHALIAFGPRHIRQTPTSFSYMIGS